MKWLKGPDNLYLLGSLLQRLIPLQFVHAYRKALKLRPISVLPLKSVSDSVVLIQRLLLILICQFCKKKKQIRKGKKKRLFSSFPLSNSLLKSLLNVVIMQ